MKKTFLISLVFWLPGVASYSQQTRLLDSIVNRFEKANLFLGSVLVAKDGKTLLQKGYGFANASFKVPNDAQTIYQIGSITKQFTAAAILSLQENGKLSVNDKISTYFPELKGAERITIHHLLSHTSGLYNYTDDTALWYSRLSESRLVDFLNSKAPLFEPGAEMRYCNSGYILAGYIIEKVSKKKYEQFIRELIFQPLGMTQSGFDFGNLKSPSKATGYYDNGSLNANALIIDSTVSFSAGAIYSTVGDMNKWSQAIHNKVILAPTSWAAMTTANKKSYGYGLVLDSVAGEKRIWHNGGIDGFVSSFYYLPNSNGVIVTLSNYMQSNTLRLCDALSAALLNKPFTLPEVRNEVSLTADVLQQYVGRYQLAPGFILAVTFEEGKLMAQATGQEKFPLFAEKENFFFLKVVDAQVEFEKDANGKVNALTLHQSGMHLKGEKIQ